MFKKKDHDIFRLWHSVSKKAKQRVGKLILHAAPSEKKECLAPSSVYALHGDRENFLGSKIVCDYFFGRIVI